MSAAPRFLVSGYYGFGNTGDEAILAGLVEGFRELCPAAELTVLSGNPADSMAEHGVIAVPRGLRSVRRQVKLCDVLISGGGGLLQDVTSWRSPLYYLAAMHLAQSARRPVACIGQSIGPLRRGWVRALVRRQLSRAAIVALRDELSQQSLVGLGLPRRAEVTADLAFLLPAPTEPDISAARAKAGLTGVSDPVAAISLRRTPGSADRGDVMRVAAVIGKSCDELGLRPLLVPMQPSQDVALAEAVADVFPSRNALIASGLRAREILALIASCRMVIAMRLHALIFAALSGVPPVAISYDPKVDGLMAQLCLPPPADLRQPNGGRLAQAIRETWNQRDTTSRALTDRLPHLRSLALRNVELALAVLPRQ
jgi:polysaccharide pyruvyl transferase CsaB